MTTNAANTGVTADPQQVHVSAQKSETTTSQESQAAPERTAAIDSYIGNCLKLRDILNRMEMSLPALLMLWECRENGKFNLRDFEMKWGQAYVFNGVGSRHSRRLKDLGLIAATKIRSQYRITQAGRIFLNSLTRVLR